MKHFRMLAAGLCSAVLLCGFAIPAYAYSDSGNEEPPVVEETPAPEPAPTITPGEGFSKDGNLVTRDLLYDKATNKQFLTIETKAGNTFYIVIDYDAPVNEDEEQYQTYFLNMVDENDLLALMDDEAAAELTTCICETRCEAGAVNTECPVCKTNMSECTGAVPEPETPPEPEEPMEEDPDQKSNVGLLIGVIAIVGLGGGAYYYFKFVRGKKEPDEDLDFFDDDGYEEEPYINEDEEPDIAEDDAEKEDEQV